MKLVVCLVCLQALSSIVRAHVPFPSSGTPLLIPLGQERSFYIVADVEEENATVYSYTSNSNEAVAAVQGPLAFSRKEFGSWRIRGDSLGPATIVFHWKYAKDSSGNEGERDETLHVEVVVPGTSSAENPYHINIVDPVNSRNGEYHSEEAFGPNLGGPMPLGFASYYSSSLMADGIAAGALGANRLHNFEWRLTTEVPNRRVNVRTDHGRMVTFEKRGLTNVWTQTGRADTVCRLMEEGGIFYFFSPAAQRVWVFDAAGKLTKIIDGRGNTLTLAYTAGTLTGVADGLGRTLTFAYTGARLTRVTDHAGRHVDFAFTGSNLTQFADALGHSMTFVYDAANLLTSLIKPEGNSPFTQVFTAGKVTSQTERGADTTTMDYGANATIITQPGGATMTHSYAPTGEITAYTDEAGKIMTLASDATGRRTTVNDRAGDGTGITYHALSGLPATITNAEGRVSTMAYKARLLKVAGVADVTKALTFFDLSAITFPDGTKETFIQDAFGNLLSRTDRAGKIWKFTYNNRGQVLSSTNPVGGVFLNTYDAVTGNLLSRKDPDTEVTTYAYDALNRLITITRPGSATVTFTYDAADRLLTTRDERSNLTTFNYDNNDRLTAVTDADAKLTTYAYDALDRLESVTDRRGATRSVTYDSRRLLASSTDGNGNPITFAYDERQRPIGMTDSGGKTWTMGFDNEGLLISAANPVDPPLGLKRNRLGRVVEASDPLGNTALMTRDAMQRVTASFDPLGRKTSFTYDKRGSLITATEQGTGTATYARDALGLLSKITDPNGGTWLFIYTKAGRLTGATDPLGRKTAHAYDARGRRTVTTFADAPTTLTRAYDVAGNVTQRLFTGGPDLTFDYDNLNRLTATNELALSYDAEGHVANSGQAGDDFGATYDAGGRLLTLTSPSNAAPFTITYGYDTRDRLVSVGDNLSNASVVLAYDDAGRLTSMTRSNGVNVTHTYDAAGRLIHIMDGTVLDLAYGLNAASEITSVDYTAPLIPGVTAATQPLLFNKAAQITTTGYAYDLRGRLTAAPGRTFAWDGASRLTNAAGVALTYNGLGDVITRTVGAATTRFFYNYALRLHPIVAEKTGGAFERFYVWTPNGRLLYAIDAASNTPVFYHFDRVGSTLALSDHTGAVIETYAYGPYGEPLGSDPGASTQPFTYIGAYGVRKEGALYQMRARYYDPGTARFLSRDPVPPRLADVKSLNPYAYANDNPVRYVDLNGGEATDSHPDAVDGITFFAMVFGVCETPQERRKRKSAALIASINATIGLLEVPVQAGGKRSRIKIIQDNAAKFGGVAHSTAAGMVAQVLDSTAGLGGPTAPNDRRSPFKIAENESPRPANRVFFNDNPFGIEIDDVRLPLGGESVGGSPRNLGGLDSDGTSGASGLPDPDEAALERLARPNDGLQMLLEVNNESPLIGGEFSRP